MEKKIGVGLIGFGNSAKNFHAPLIRASNHFHLKKIVRKSQTELLESFADCERVQNVNELLTDNSIDLVIITTPNHLHYDQAMASLKAKKHVVVEKPFTVTTEQAKELINLSKSVSKVLTVYQNRRWDGDFLTIKKLLKEKPAGQVVEFESSFNRFRNYFKKDAWKEKPLPGSGILYDLAPHLVDQVLQLFGPPNELYADIRAQREGETDDYFVIDLYYPSFKAKIKAGMLVPEQTPRFVLRCKNGSYVKYGLDPQESDLSSGKSPLKKNWGKEGESKWGTLYRWDGSQIQTENIETIAGNYLEFYQQLESAILQNEKPPVDPYDAQRVISLIELARKSNELGKRLQVTLP